jgi:hypothetical protein
MKLSLDEFIDSFQTKLNGVCEAIFETFFAQAPLGEQRTAPAVIEPSLIAQPANA